VCNGQTANNIDLETSILRTAIAGMKTWGAEVFFPRTLTILSCAGSMQRKVFVIMASGLLEYLPPAAKRVKIPRKDWQAE
jgi:hypothetical protein